MHFFYFFLVLFNLYLSSIFSFSLATTFIYMYIFFKYIYIYHYDYQGASLAYPKAKVLKTYSQSERPKTNARPKVVCQERKVASSEYQGLK